MKTQNLAAVYRPTSLSDYVGQEHIVKPLTQMLKYGNLPATVLIAGPTGCGKTTLAYLLSRYLNCEKGNACGKCRSCKMMDSETHPDFMYFDMGTAGKVDNIRNLIQNVNYLPTFKKRVIVCDEAHVITKAAANALLVTTENPPPDTIFIFCTTEPDQMIQTMLGRCVKFFVKQVDEEPMLDRLYDIYCDEYGEPQSKQCKRVEQVISLCAASSGGLMRDAIQALQLVGPIATTAPVQEIKQMLNTVGSAAATANAAALISAFIAQDPCAVVQAARASDSAMSVIGKARWLLHQMVGEVAKANKFMTEDARTLYRQFVKQKLTLLHLVYLRNTLEECNQHITSVAAIGDPLSLLETKVLYLMAQIYEGKLSLQLE